MSFFTATSETKFKGPHQETKVAKAGVPASEADAAMIMIHGRGATAPSILDMVSQFKTDKKITYRAPQASGNTWYPYSFLSPTDQNQPGLSSGLQKIYDIIEELEAEGISKENIYLLGFSQGACLASEFAARHPAKYAGLIALSGGVIGESVDLDQYEGDLAKTPAFLGCSDVDAHIPEERVHETEEVLNKLGANVTKKLYPGMGHLVNNDEIEHINALLNQ